MGMHGDDSVLIRSLLAPLGLASSAELQAYAAPDQPEPVKLATIGMRMAIYEIESAERLCARWIREAARQSAEAAQAVTDGKNLPDPGWLNQSANAYATEYARIRTASERLSILAPIWLAALGREPVRADPAS